MENFWEFRFIDIISVLTLFISPIIIYFIYKKIEKWREKQSLISLIKKLKYDIETFFIGDFFDKSVSFFEANLPFYRSQQEKLIKLGIVIKSTGNNEEIMIDEDLAHFLNPLIVILNKYYIGTSKSQNHQMIITLKTFKQQKDFKSVNEIEDMFKDMIDYANNYFNIKLSEKLIDLGEYKKTREELEKEYKEKQKN